MKIVIDSDALFALYVSSDVHHQKAKKILSKLLDKKTDLIVSNLVFQETATVISYRFGQKPAKNFVKKFRSVSFQEFFINQKITAKSWEIFKSQAKKGTSFVDCANVAICSELNTKQVFSFDKFYQRQNLNLFL